MSPTRRVRRTSVQPLPSEAGTTGQSSAPREGGLDDVDRRILAELAADGRVSVNELAVRAGVSRATAYARFDKLRESGAIRGFTVDADPGALGYGIAALILVNVEQHSWRAARDELLKLPGLEYVALTSGGFDFVVLVRVPDIDALRDVVLVRLQGLPQIRSTQTIFVLDEQRRNLAAATLRQ
jgi:DNA-binding Lrp family transcriptional regulator